VNSPRIEVNKGLLELAAMVAKASPDNPEGIIHDYWVLAALIRTLADGAGVTPDAQAGEASAPAEALPEYPSAEDWANRDWRGNPLPRLDEPGEGGSGTSGLHGPRWWTGGV
jgi:hypothetical protein